MGYKQANRRRIGCEKSKCRTAINGHAIFRQNAIREN